MQIYIAIEFFVTFQGNPNYIYFKISPGRYIYIPMGGSRCSMLKMLFSTAITFTFVSYWHGSHSYLWSWAALNWLGITAENGVKRLVCLPVVHEFIVSIFPLPVHKISSCI